MRLTVLGSQGTWPGASRECCGYLVSAQGFTLWLDAGTGTFSRLRTIRDEVVGAADQMRQVAKMWRR